MKSNKSNGKQNGSTNDGADAPPNRPWRPDDPLGSSHRDLIAVAGANLVSLTSFFTAGEAAGMTEMMEHILSAQDAAYDEMCKGKNPLSPVTYADGRALWIAYLKIALKELET